MIANANEAKRSETTSAGKKSILADIYLSLRRKYNRSSIARTSNKMPREMPIQAIT